MPKKLSAQETETYKQVLLLLRAKLTGDIEELELGALTTDGSKASVDNPADAGSDSFSQEFTLGLLARDEATLAEIVRALERLEEGRFGVCERCEQLIPRSRLREVPYARHCIECQRSEERG